MFEDDGAFGFLVKGKNGIAAEILHGLDEVEAGLARHEVAVKGLAAQRTRDGAVRTDKPEIEPKLLGDGEGESVAASGYENDLDTRGMGAAQGGEIRFGYFELWVKEGAVDIGGDEADGGRLPAVRLWCWRDSGSGHSLL